MPRHPYTGRCQDCGCPVKRPLLICAKTLGYENGCLERRQEVAEAAALDTIERALAPVQESIDALSSVARGLGSAGVKAGAAVAALRERLEADPAFVVEEGADGRVRVRLARDGEKPSDPA